MQEGDLVHIPQSVNLFNMTPPLIEVTEKPALGIFISHKDERHCSIYIMGCRRLVETRKIYPMEETNGPS
jgi:hypothetical protein